MTRRVMRRMTNVASMPEPKDNGQKTAQPPSDPTPWAVLRSKVAFWRESAQFGVIAFVLVLGVGTVVWTLVTGRDDAASGGGFLQIFRRDQANALTEQEMAAVPAEPVARRAIDGAPLEAPRAAEDTYAVMIDNISVARPASGLSKAVHVIEAPVESAITRIMAVFDAADDVPRIGPVRSARPYFIDWAGEIDAMYVHSGGSPEALEMLEDDPVRDMNEFANGDRFWRDRSRYAPHNVYTSLQDLRDGAAARYPEYEPAGFAPWRYDDAAPVADAATGGGIAVPYGAALYDVEWKYDAERGDYVRWQGGEQQLDGADDIRAANVVVHFTGITVVDSVGRRHVRTTGTGDALVARGGRVVAATWRAEAGDRTRYYDAEGEEIAFRSGTTWVQVVANGAEVTY